MFALWAVVSIFVVPAVCVPGVLRARKCPLVDVALINPRLACTTLEVDHDPGGGLELSRATEALFLAKLVNLFVLKDYVGHLPCDRVKLDVPSGVG